MVFVSGSGDFSFDWSLVQPEVARFARACTYDRAGDAWSDPGPVPRTMRQEVYELRTLLEPTHQRRLLLAAERLDGRVEVLGAVRHDVQVHHPLQVAEVRQEDGVGGIGHANGERYCAGGFAGVPGAVQTSPLTEIEP